MALSASNPEHVLSIEQAAELLGLNPNTCYKLARADRLPVLRLGGRVLVLRKPLMAMLENGTVPPAPPEEQRSLTGKEKAEAMARADAEREAEHAKSRTKGAK